MSTTAAYAHADQNQVHIDRNRIFKTPIRFLLTGTGILKSNTDFLSTGTGILAKYRNSGS